jgi:glycosyltransferase involved in cell wall biosynthesis
VICSALHSTGLPDHVERPNRLLAPLTDAFIAVAESHACYLAAREGCPADKIHVIPNGVDVERFHPRWPNRRLQEEFGLGRDGPVAGIVAALRPEKNHEMFLHVAALVHVAMPAAQFVVVGDGPERRKLEALARSLRIDPCVRFLGTRSDIPEVLSLMDVVVLSSRMEASPICLLEAMAAEKPVVATRVGSVPDLVTSGRNGYLVAAGDSRGMAAYVLALLGDRDRAATLGRAGREFVLAHGSVDRMVEGYQSLIAEIYSAKSRVDRRESRLKRAVSPSAEQPLSTLDS